VEEYQQGALYATTRYGYNPLNQLTDTWDNSNHHTHLDYDMVGRKTAMDDPDMGHWSYGYDAAGSLSSRRTR
jgi:YD repeat-containing protein